MTGLILLGILAQSAPPLVPADGLTAEDPQPPPGATGEFTRKSNGTVCFVVADEKGELSQLCRSAFGDYPLPLGAGPADSPIEPTPRRKRSLPPPPVEPVEPEDLRDDSSPSRAKSQFGVVALAAGTGSLNPSTGVPEVGGVIGIGLRYGFLERSTSHRMWMPAIALVVGTGFQVDSVSPFAELRAELMSVSPGGPLQPNFVVYGVAGGTSIPLGQGNPFSVQPHLGFGLGWNWLPRGGGGGGGSWGGGWGSWGGGGGSGAAVLLVVAVAVVAVVGFVFAGRVEVRYTARPVTGRGSDYVSLLVGYGF